MRDHPSEESRGECTPREAKDVDTISRVVVTHDEAVSGDDMGVEAGSKRHVEDGFVLPRDSANEAHIDWTICWVCAYARCKPVSKRRC